MLWRVWIPIALAVMVVATGCSESEFRSELPFLLIDEGRVVLSDAEGDTVLFDDGTNSVAGVARGPEPGHVYIEQDGGVLLFDGSEASHLGNGSLLASSRDGRRVIVAHESRQLVIISADGETVVDGDCAAPAGAVWDQRDDVLAVVCGDRLLIYSESTETVDYKLLTGTGIDITNWGDGFAVLVDAGATAELWRTPASESQLLGKLGDVEVEDVVEIVAGISFEALIVRTTDGALLAVEVSGSDTSAIRGNVSAIAEVEES